MRKNARVLWKVGDSALAAYSEKKLCRLVNEFDTDIKEEC